ncbi:MAG: 3-hydroxyacyl-CoA dehydrogenase [Pseudomonadota bacterium]
MGPIENDEDGGSSFKQIAIVGCGLIGQAWATVFLRAGAEVRLFDVVEGAAEQAAAQIKDRLQELHRFSLIPDDVLRDAPGRIAVAHTLKEAVADAEYVQENGPENLEIKAALTRDILSFSAPDTPVGSSTSGIPASSYAEHLSGRERCLVAHPINPPHLVPLVEVVPSVWTDPQVTQAVETLLRTVGQVPILLRKEIDGFVVNRLQGALLREAFNLLDAGVASREAIDLAVSRGLGLRWSLMGPFETIHLNAPGGVADYVERFGRMYAEMFADERGASPWTDVVASGLGADLARHTPAEGIPAAQKQRDEALMTLLAGQS